MINIQGLSSYNNLYEDSQSQICVQTQQSGSTFDRRAIETSE